MNTASNAHVCTPGRVPILGELEVECDRGDADAVKINMVYASGHVDVLKPGDNDRRWWAIGTEDVPRNLPGQFGGFLRPIGRTHDTTADLHQSRSLSDCYHYETDDGRLAAAAHRHANKKGQKWTCWLFIRDYTGAEWVRDFPAVTDDFGWLVEVPAC
ncbi:hypothetical protein [Comamonas terrigena]|uniref:hypothetical protein n=1 Tax=Comamonas terrigena TaxID=32013 RepID=UPI002448DB87|nr:hypothetical protein [Comamonas terrigena]MDH0049651.1 hypothetical protein [Comamonas terrigena]MDH0511303.1 hypothetical protein [Comamonas terrigena]MDH1091394.1 hypothetical protein [Comamonas terrigena]